MTTRRVFIAGLGGAAAWPLAARAQQANQLKRIGVLMTFAENDPEGQARIATFRQALQHLGWASGRTVQIEYRWVAGDAGGLLRSATELAAFAPDIILAVGSSTVAALQQVSGEVPIVFVNVIDPVGAGLVASLARPGRNATGFTVFEYGISAKWLELLKQIAPHVRRAAVIRDATIAAGVGQWAVIQAAAPASTLEVIPIEVRDDDVIERTLAVFARSANGGLIVTGSPSAGVHRDLIITLAARYSLPAVYFARYFVAHGGLISYGPDLLDPYRRAATYIDRILKGEKPADLPIQAPTKYELVINLKTAKALGLEVPPTLLARADEVIE
jgi:putative ABC transport system substrate-binding protein